jgi:surface antigen Omp85-like protein
MRILKLTLTAAVFTAFIPVALPAQDYAPRESVTVVPGARYRASGLHRFFFGSRYRRLWTTPIRVPLLKLQEFAGGLKPTQRGGGMQTKSLRFSSPDGREYQFRSIDKDPTPVLPPDLRETIARDILRDQISATHPGGALIVGPLLESAGVLHSNPIVVQMADDPGLGEFRADFAGVLGTIEERPRQLAEGATFAGASDIVGTADLFKKLDDDPTIRVDARAFLLARLVDVYVGDWDRHADQWRWALVDSGGPKRWLPIPRDRDQAFARYDGFLLSQARRVEPKLLNFSSHYDDMVGATWNGRDLDRRLLMELEKPAWDSVARLLKPRLTDAAITKAARAMPPEFYPLDGPRLEKALRGRRDHFDRMSDRYYRMLAHQAEVYGSDKADQAVVDRQAGATVVTLSANGKQYFRRSLPSDETQEVRIHLQGGGDQLRVQGEGSSSPLVRVVGGGGDDVFTVTRSGGVHLYDDRGTNRAEGAGINTKAWRWKPVPPAWQKNADSAPSNALPPRDWGRKTTLWPSGTWAYDVGAVLGYGGHTDWFAFRRAPYSTRLSYRVEFATQKGSGRATLGIKRRFENSRAFYALETMASGIETLRWYGFGNETVQNGSVSFYRVNRNELAAELKLGRSFGRQHEISIGPLVRWSQTDLSEKHNAVRFIAADAPYGTEEFGLVGLRAGIKIDGRDYPKFASKGAALSLQATGYPKMWDADEAIGRVEGEASLNLAPQGRWRPSLNLMAGGVKTWGKLPFFLAPTLGGLHTLRGYRPDRFAGDAAVYGSADLRIPLTRIKLVVPGQQGIFGFVDGGRVYLRGEVSDKWHSSFGGGVWFTFLTRDQVIFAGAGKPTKDKEGTRFILGFGFPY